MPESNENSSKTVSIISVILLLVFGFWQSWSGAFIYILGFILGAFIMYTEDNKKK